MGSKRLLLRIGWNKSAFIFSSSFKGAFSLVEDQRFKWQIEVSDSVLWRFSNLVDDNDHFIRIPFPLFSGVQPWFGSTQDFLRSTPSNHYQSNYSTIFPRHVNNLARLSVSLNTGIICEAFHKNSRHVLGYPSLHQPKPNKYISS
jgi:hypothetical protein